MIKVSYPYPRRQLCLETWSPFPVWGLQMFVWELDLFQQGNTSQQSRTVACQLAMKIGKKGEKRERGQEEERDEGEED